MSDVAARVETVYVVHHSHTDIGYTHEQPVLWDLERRFIDEAIRLAWRDRNEDEDHSFRWTIETIAPLCYWLDRASSDDRERLRVLNQLGRIDISGMYLNITPLYDTAQLIEALQPVHTLRETHGLRVRAGMNCDVNGQNWQLVELLLDAGVEGFSMAINEAWGGAPLRTPAAFWWEGSSGRRILAWNGFGYGKGNAMGIGDSADKLEREGWPAMAAHLAQSEYPLPILMVQSIHPFSDNGPPDPRLGPFTAAWNRAGKAPRVRLSTLSEWFDALRAHSDALPVCRGDWTDYWNFGCGSSAREQATNRESRTRLIVADLLRATAGALARQNALAPGESASKSIAEDQPAPADELGPAAIRDAAWQALNLYDEHTWGADASVRAPDSDDTRYQWLHKAAQAAQARSLSLLLQRDGLAYLARRVERPVGEQSVLVVNPLPWMRRLAGPVAEGLLQPRGLGEDPTSARHYQDRVEGRNCKPTHLLPPIEVPACGYRVVRLGELIEIDEHLEMPPDGYGEEEVVESARYCLAFDRERGGIRSWWDLAARRELVDGASGFALGTLVHEEVADRGHSWPRNLLWRSPPPLDGIAAPRGWRPGWRARRTMPTRVLAHKVWRTSLAVEVHQTLEIPTLPGLVQLRFRLPHDGDHLECDAEWTMGLTTHPEATYLAFPLAVPEPVCHLDLGGVAVQPERDQIPGSCRDYFTVQQWVDFSCTAFGVTVACPINPLVQLGDFRFAANLHTFDLPRALLLGWATNNYWETNFRAHQPGVVRARYWLRPHEGPFRAAEAHRFGLEASHPPLLQALTESAAPGVPLPALGSLLDLPAPPAVVVHVKPIKRPRSAAVTLTWIGESPGIAEIGAGLLGFKRARRCDVFGQPGAELRLRKGKVGLEMRAGEVVTICLEDLSV